MKIQLFYLILSLSFGAFSKEGEPDLKKILSQLRKFPMVTFEVEKKIKSELMGSESVSPGVIYVTKNKFRWDTDGRDKSRIIFDGRIIWTIQDPPKGFKTSPQVTKMKIDTKSEGQIFLNSLFQENFDAHFKITKSIKDKSNWRYKLSPTQKNPMVSDIEISVGANGEITQIAYSDEVENKINVVINRIKKVKKVDSKLFEYTPPSGTQVNEI